MQPGDKDTNYILTTMPAADAETWFGKAPPDLSLMARARGTDCRATVGHHTRHRLEL